MGLVALTLTACDTTAPIDDIDDNDDGDGGGTMLPPGAVLVAQVDGNEPGIWLFDPETLERETVVESISRAVGGMAFSPDYERWYMNWGIGSILDSTAQRVLATFDPKSRSITNQVTMPNLALGAYLTYDALHNQIIAYGGSRGLRFFDATTLALVEEQPLEYSEAYIGAEAAIGSRGHLYFGANAGAEGELIHLYDSNQRAFTGTIELIEDEARRARTRPTDLTLSPDEHYLYVTTFTSFGLDGVGAFFMVDLETGEVVAEERAGKYATMAVSPNGRYVYIDCPAGGMRELGPTNQVLRFDTQMREMEVFIDGPEGLGLEGTVLITDQITMLPDGGFILKIGGAVRNGAGEDVHLVRVDAKTGQALKTYAFPRDERGFITTIVRQLKFGVVPM